MVYFYGMTEECIKAIGKKTKCMVVASTNGQMEKFMMENITKVKNKDSVFINGKMIAIMKDFGKMDINMVQDIIKVLKVILLDWGYGKMESELNGQKKQIYKSNQQNGINISLSKKKK